MKNLIVVSVMIFLMASCNHEGNEHQHPEESNSKEEVLPAEVEQPEVSLNKGSKWTANPETTEGINNMLHLVKSFEGDNYIKLRENLQEEFKGIFKKCTMTGDAHDQLHNYLIPLKSKIEGIEEGKLKELEIYLEEYFNYFE